MQTVSQIWENINVRSLTIREMHK